MVWHFIGIYIINRTLHGRLEIRNFSSRVEKYFTRSLRSLVKYFSTVEEKFRISARPCNILYVFCNKHFHLCNFYCYDKKTRNIDHCIDFCLRFRSTICPVRLFSSPDLCSDSVSKRGSSIDNRPPWLFILRDH